MSIRTDLIAEIKQDTSGDIEGVETHEETVGDVNISTVKIISDTASNILQKPKRNNQI